LVEKHPVKVVILGAGVAGLRVALKLESQIRPEKAQIILIDENDYHQLLYRIQKVCNFEYEEKDVVIPISRLIQGKKIEYKKMKIKSVDPENRIVITDVGDVTYDYLVVALGSHVEFFGIDGVEKNSLNLNSFESAKLIRTQLEELFSKFNEFDHAPKIVVGGGGFTGVELAGEISDWIEKIYQKEESNEKKPILTLIEATPSVLPGWNNDLINDVQDFLEARNIKLILNDPVVKVSSNEIELKSGLAVDGDLFIWTGGVRGDPACGINFTFKKNKILIDDFCRAQGFENVFVAGDSACTTDDTGRVMQPTAHIAMEQGDIVAHNIQSFIEGKEMKKYEYTRIGEIVTIGKSFAVGELYGIKFTGVLARILKKFVHLWYLRSIGGFSLMLNN
jgi:NADH dehydrogenase